MAIIKSKVEHVKEKPKRLFLNLKPDDYLTLLAGDIIVGAMDAQKSKRMDFEIGDGRILSCAIQKEKYSAIKQILNY